MVTNKQMTREAWLNQAAGMLAVQFQSHGYQLPAVRISTGFGGSRGSRLKVLGTAWNAKASDDNVAQVFISPILDDSLRVLDVLVHELIHTIVPSAGHGPAFRKIALAMGLTGKMTATIATPELIERLNVMLEDLGQYPHAKLNPSESGIKKQGTRMIKCECQACGYTVRTTRTWLEQSGAPLCPCNQITMTVR